MKPIRNSAKAIIIKNGKLLCTKNQDHLGIFYLLPGGGQEFGENLVETLKRECMEEIRAEIIVGDIKFIREYIGKNHEFAEYDNDIHQVEYMFECKLQEGAEIRDGKIPDSMQIGVEWLELSRLKEFRVYPGIIKELIDKYGIIKSKIYLGDVN